ncbi:MAG TPA: hypothetical protein PK095_04180, partial [Myxococcota bacterium]|nr:hypothetical protein [Myxococcota bacterium]
EPVAEAPPVPEAKGLFECKKVEAPPARDTKDPWGFKYDVPPCPAIPSTFGAITFGMDHATAAAAAEEAKTGDAKFQGTSGYIYVGKHPFRTQFAVRFDEAGKVDQFVHKIDQKGFDLLKATWGEPVMLVDGDDKEFRWYNPENKIMVTADPDSYDRANAETKEDEKVEGYRLRFAQYAPLADVLGADGLIAKALLGKTPDEVKALVPELLEVKTAEQAKADLAAVGLDADTQKKAEALGAADAKINLRLAPTPSNEHFTLVHMDWEGGKLEGYSFSLDHEKKEDIKNELLAQIAALLGKPTASKLDDGKPEYTFAGPNGLVVRVSPSILEDSWKVAVAAK